MKPQRICITYRNRPKLQEMSMALNGLPAVDCARPSKYGNQYRIGDSGPDGKPMTREDVIRLHKKFVDNFQIWRAFAS